MRAVLAGEDGGGIQRWLLRRMSDSMQIESLWRFNAKFGPEWLPRYVVWDAAENTLPIALAIARAESFWELPLIGRFFQPPGRQPRREVGRVPLILHGRGGSAAAASGIERLGGAHLGGCGPRRSPHDARPAGRDRLIGGAARLAFPGPSVPPGDGTQNRKPAACTKLTSGAAQMPKTTVTATVMKIATAVGPGTTTGPRLTLAAPTLPRRVRRSIALRPATTAPLRRSPCRPGA